MSRKILGGWFVAVFAVAAAVLPRNSAALPPIKVVPNGDQVYFGHYDISSVGPTYEEFLAKSGGPAPAITFTFQDWNAAGIEASTPVLQTLNDPLEGEDSPTPLEMAYRVGADGGVLALAWDAVGYVVEHPDYFTTGATSPVTWEDLFAGRYDDYIRTVAREVKDFGFPIMLSPTGEINAVGYFSFGERGNRPLDQIADAADIGRFYGDPDEPDGPERVRDLYRHVIDIFNDEGVTNVTWFMYSHTGYMNPDAYEDGDDSLLEYVHPRHYFPGEEYVDWIGASIYVDAEDPDLDLDYQAADAVRAWNEVTDKPFFAPEFGVTSQPGVDRSDAIRKLFEEDLPQFEEIQALAMADGDLWAQFFDIPRLGHVDGELDAWREAVIENDRYTNELRFDFVPEPNAAALSLAALAIGVTLRRGAA